MNISSIIKIYCIVFIVCLFMVTTYGQTEVGASWYFTLSNPDLSKGEENNLIISVDLPEDWGIYSSDFVSASFGPEPTRFSFEVNDSVKLMDRVRAVNATALEDPALDLHYTYFIGKAEFRQCIIVKSSHASIQGFIKGKYFHRTSGRTIDFEKPFDLKFE